MALGDITSTFEGSFARGSTALLTELDTLNTGAATAGADITSIILVPSADGQTVDVGGTIYEFSDDESVPDGRRYVAIGASEDDSWNNFAAAVTSFDQNVRASNNPGANTVTIESNYGGDYGDGYVVADGPTPTGATFSGNLAGGSGGVAVLVHIW